MFNYDAIDYDPVSNDFADVDESGMASYNPPEYIVDDPEWGGKPNMSYLAADIDEENFLRNNEKILQKRRKKSKQK